MPTRNNTALQLVWLRTDLRLEDNPALHHAAKKGAVICVFVASPQQWQSHDEGAARQTLLRSRLQALQLELEQKQIALKVLYEPSYDGVPKALATLAQTLGAQGLWWNIEYPLNEQNRDKAVGELCVQNNIETHEYHADVIQPPGSVRTQTGNIYHVFTPFARQWRKQVSDGQLATVAAPRKQAVLDIDSDSIERVWPASEGHEHYRADLWPVDSKTIQFTPTYHVARILKPLKNLSRGATTSNNGKRGVKARRVTPLSMPP